MKIPERVKVGGFWYSIEGASEFLSSRALLGESKNDALTITLDDTAALSVIKETLLHELVHVADFYLPNNVDLTELQIMIVARVLFQVFTENPEVRKFIFEEES